MGLIKRVYTDEETLITAQNLNDIQDAVIGLEDGLFSIDNTKSGEVVTITDAYKRSFRSLSIFGRTTQDGTPTPDAPVDLVNIGDSGSITVNVTGKNEAQSMTIATPNGLPGIPVESGGNYTDANGQQWICDEVDLARGVFVKRVGDAVLNGSEVWEMQGTHLYFYTHIHDRKPATNLLCDRLTNAPLYDAEVPGWWADNADNQLFVAVGFGKAGIADTPESFRAYLAEHPLALAYVLATPIETPLSAEEIAAYSALHTYKDRTTVSNDASAHMELEYVMDSKKYFDSLSTGGIVPATVE